MEKPEKDNSQKREIEKPDIKEKQADTSKLEDQKGRIHEKKIPEFIATSHGIYEPHSEDIIYQITRNSSCFVRNKKHFGMTKFTTEKGNLTALNSLKYSGLNNKSIGIFRSKKGGIAMRIKDPKLVHQPNKMWRKKKLSNDYYEGAIEIANVWLNNVVLTLQTLMEESRSDLLPESLIRYKKLRRYDNRKKSFEDLKKVRLVTKKELELKNK